jgi:hypothetical protein
MAIQNADEALRAIVNALDDVPPIVRETLKNKRRQEIEDSFFSSYFDKNPEYRVEVPAPTISNNAEYAKALAKDKAVKQKILEQTRARIQAEAAEAANRRFVELGYSEDLPNARDIAKDLYHEEIINSPLPYISNRWQPTIYQDELPEIRATPGQKPGNVKVRRVVDDGLSVDGLSANVPQDTPQPQRGFNPETLLPEGLKIDVAIAIAKQNAAKKFPNNTKQENKQFFKEMEAQGIVRDVATGQWVDRRIIGEWGDIGGGKTGRTVDKSKLDAMRASYEQSALEQAPQLSPPPSNAMTEAVNPASGQSLLDSQPQSVPHNVGIVKFDEEKNEWIPVQSSNKELTTEDIGTFSRTPREEAETAWAFSGQFDFKNVVIDGKTRGIPWEKEEWIQNYLGGKSAPLPSNTEAEAILNDLDNLILNPQPQPTPQPTPQEVLVSPTPIPTDSGAIAPEAASVLLTQPGMPVTPQPEVVVSVPQYEGNSSVATAPPSGVNNAVYPGSKAVGTSSDLPSGGDYDFEGQEFNRQNNYTFPGSTPNHPEIPGLNDPVDPDANLKSLWERIQRETQAREQYLNNKAREEANTGNYWQNLWDGVKRGFQYSVDAGRRKGRTASVGWNRAPEDQYAHLQDEGRFGFGVGRTIGDGIGNGSRQVLWNLHPADFVGTHAPDWLGEDATRMAQVVVPFAAVTGLELGSQIYNPFNLGQGGRVAGYQAINPDDEDPRISTTPVSELLIDRGLLGKRGRLLPWEQFRQERTDIPYEQYEKYQNYLRNKDENFLRDATGGLIKGTLDGINGPELSVMGYSVTPTGALAAGAALLAGRELVRTGRIAGFRKQ